MRTTMSLRVRFTDKTYLITSPSVTSVLRVYATNTCRVKTYAGISEIIAQAVKNIVTAFIVTTADKGRGTKVPYPL